MLEFSYFDAQNGTYVTSRSRPIALSVEGGTIVSADNVVSRQDGAKIGRSNEQQSAPMSLSGANLKQSKSSEYTESRTIIDVIPVVVFFYIAPLLALFLMKSPYLKPLSTHS